MSEARKDPAKAPEADAILGDPLIHDDDELAAALQAQLERFAPSGSIPVITPQRAAQYRADTSGTPRSGSVPAAPPASPSTNGAAAVPVKPPAGAAPVQESGPEVGSRSFGDAGERLPSVHRPPLPPASSFAPTTVPTDTGSMRRPQWPTFAQADTPGGGHAAVSVPDPGLPYSPAGRHTGGGARVPVRTGPISVQDTGTVPPSPVVEEAPPAPDVPAAPASDAPGTVGTDTYPSRRDLRFSSPVPHFDPPSLPVPIAPPTELTPAPEPVPETPPVAQHQGPTALEELERLQPQLAQVRLDPQTAAEWEQALRRIADAPPPVLPPLPAPTALAPPSAPPRPDLAPFALPSEPQPVQASPAELPPIFTAPIPAAGYAAPSSRPIGDVSALPIPHDPDEDVVHAELVDDDDDVDDHVDAGEQRGTHDQDASAYAAPQAPAGDDVPAGVPAVQAHAGPVPATGATALVGRGRTPDEEAPAAETSEVMPLALDGITTDTGAINTGSLPIVTASTLDRDLDDDVDDIVAPQELLLEVGTTGEVGIVGAGPDTGQVAPVSSTSIRTAVLTVPTPEQAAPSTFGIEPADLAPTDEDQRLRRPVSQFWLWLAPNSSALTLALGASLIAFGISFRQALIAAVLGVVTACLTLAVGVLASKRTGQPVAVVSRAAFGLRGNLLPTLVLLVVRLFWAAVLAWLAAATVRSVITAAGWDSVVPAEVGGVIAGVILTVVACLIAVFGHGLLARVHLVLGALSAVLLILLIALTVPLVDFTTVLAVPDGAPLRLVGAAVAVLSLLAVAWVSAGGELARYQSPGSSGTATAGWAAFGAALPAFVLTAWGVLLAASVGAAQADALASDPVAALLDRLPSWYPLPLLLAVMLGLVAALATVLYSTGLTLGAAGLRLHRVYRTIAAAAVAVAAGLALLVTDAPLDALLGGLVPVLAVPVVAWTGILATEFFLRTKPFDSSSLLVRGGRYPDIRWAPVGALVLITVLGIGLVGGDGYAGIAGYLWRLFGVAQDSPLAQADLGVPLALVLGLLTPLLVGRAELRRQEGRGPAVATLEE